MISFFTDLFLHLTRYTEMFVLYNSLTRLKMVKHTLKIWYTAGFLKCVWPFFNIMLKGWKKARKLDCKHNLVLSLIFVKLESNSSRSVFHHINSLCAFVKAMLYGIFWWGICSEKKNAFAIVLAQVQLHPYLNMIFCVKFRHFMSYARLFL